MQCFWRLMTYGHRAFKLEKLAGVAEDAKYKTLNQNKACYQGSIGSRPCNTSCGL